MLNNEHFHNAVFKHFNTATVNAMPGFFTHVSQSVSLHPPWFQRRQPFLHFTNAPGNTTQFLPVSFLSRSPPSCQRRLPFLHFNNATVNIMPFLPIFLSQSLHPPWFQRRPAFLQPSTVFITQQQRPAPLASPAFRCALLNIGSSSCQ